MIKIFFKLLRIIGYFLNHFNSLAENRINFWQVFKNFLTWVFFNIVIPIKTSLTFFSLAELHEAKKSITSFPDLLMEVAFVSIAEEIA